MRIEAVPVGGMFTNCYLVHNETLGQSIIIDPGAEPIRLTSMIGDRGISLQAILLTHGHFDHIMAVNELREAFHVPVYASAAEAELLADPALNHSYRIRHQYSVVADELLEDDTEFEVAGIKFRTIYTPGHTRGGICYYSETEHVLFSGDTLFKESIGRTDLPTGNSHLLLESLRNRLAKLPPETVVYPGHGEDTQIGYELRNNPYLLGNSYYD